MILLDPNSPWWGLWLGRKKKAISPPPQSRPHVPLAKASLHGTWRVKPMLANKTIGGQKHLVQRALVFNLNLRALRWDTRSPQPQLSYTSLPPTFKLPLWPLEAFEFIAPATDLYLQVAGVYSKGALNREYREIEVDYTWYPLSRCSVFLCLTMARFHASLSWAEGLAPGGSISSFQRVPCLSLPCFLSPLSPFNVFPYCIPFPYVFPGLFTSPYTG